MKSFKKYIKDAIAYVNEGKDWSEAEEQVAWADMDMCRCPLRMTQTGEGICDRIAELMDEFGDYNNLPIEWQDWWRENYDEEDIFMKLDD